MADQFIQFCAHLKEKFPEGITAFHFEKELSRRKELLNFIKKVVKNIENNFEFSNGSLFFPNPNSKNSLLGEIVSGPLISVEKGSAPTIDSSSKKLSSGSLVSLDEKEFDPILGSTSQGVVSGSLVSLVKKENDPVSGSASKRVCGPLSTCPDNTNMLVSSPVLFNYFGGSSIKTTSVGVGITEFKFNEADLKKDFNSLAKKYKLANLFVANLLIDFKIPNVQLTNITASNCYFKVDDVHKKKIKFPCEWKCAQGRNGSSFFWVHFENNNGQLKAVLYNDCVQNSSKEVYKLTIRQYRAKCSSKFINFRYNLSSNSYNNNLYLFIGKPNLECKCKTRSKKFEIIKSNKDVTAPQLYKTYNSEFSNTREIYNLKRKFGIFSKKP